MKNMMREKMIKRVVVAGECRGTKTMIEYAKEYKKPIKIKKIKKA